MIGPLVANARMVMTFLDKELKTEDEYKIGRIHTFGRSTLDNLSIHDSSTRVPGTCMYVCAHVCMNVMCT